MYYTEIPSRERELSCWLSVVHTKARGRIEIGGSNDRCEDVFQEEAMSSNPRRGEFIDVDAASTQAVASVLVDIDE